MSGVAVVILNYNGEKLLKQFLPSVVKYSEGASVYVADNGSTDQSVLLLEKEFPSVKIIHLPSNYGFCKGYNEALKHVVADIYVLLNSDVEVTPGWLQPIDALFEKDHEIAAIQPKILSWRNRNKFEYAGAAGGLIDRLGYPFCRGRIFTAVEEDHGQYNDEREIFWASGACMAIRAPLYHSLGGFDEDFFAHMEEIDLCWKIHRAGLKVFYTGNCTVYHLGAGTLDYASPKKTFLNFRNNLLMLIKQLDAKELVVKLLLRILLDWIAAFVFLLKGQAGSAISVVKAHMAVVSRISSTYRKRGKLRRTYPSYSHEQIYPGVILVDWYVRRKSVLRNQ